MQIPYVDRRFDCGGGYGKFDYFLDLGKVKAEAFIEK
jgi:hypothetical protein